MPVPSYTLDSCNLNPPADVAVGCAPSTIDGELTVLIFGSRKLTTEEIASLTALNAAIDNTDETGDYLHKWSVVGAQEKPEQGSTEVEGGVTIYDTQAVFTVAGRFYELSDDRYNAVRVLGANKPMYIYYGNSEVLYGGEAEFVDGINTVLNARVVHPEDGKAYVDWSFSFKSQFGPTRIDYPTDSGS